MKTAQRIFLLTALLVPALSQGAAASEGGPLIPPEKGIYTGAYVDFGEAEDSVTLEGVEAFEKMVGRRMALVASSSYWGEQSFPSDNMRIIQRHGAVPLLFWSPWDKPYDQNRGPDRFSLRAIADGKWDAYVDAWAASARQHPGPILVAWGLEMNGTWFPWSGWFYGAGQLAKQPGALSRWQGPDLYRRAYRRVVDRVRAKGARNISWVFHVNNYSYPEDHWNWYSSYYPGADYVDWLAASAYGKQFSKDPWVRFKDTWDMPYQWLCELDAKKPVLLAEWGIGEFPASGSKPDYLREALQALPRNYPRLAGAVFWHERWENGDGTFSNLRANSSRASLEAFRGGISDPLWIDRPRQMPDRGEPPPATARNTVPAGKSP